MPKFRLELPALSIKDNLSRMGMADIFTPEADFSGITEVKPASLSDVIHKAFIEVDEKKTEAAAASAVIVTVEVSLEKQIPEPLVMRIDHPFIFLIRDNRTNTILFLGRIMKPPE